MVPLPRFASLEALNGYLEQRCRERQGDVLRGHRESIAKRLERDLEAMTALPGASFDACHQAAGQVSSQSLVRYHNNDYSVPVAYGHRQVWVRGYVDRAPDRGAARPTDPSRPYPGNERPELPPQPQPRAKTGRYDLICASPPAGNCARATPSLRFRLTPPPASSQPPRTISLRRPRWQCFAPSFGLVSLRP